MHGVVMATTISGYSVLRALPSSFMSLGVMDVYEKKKSMVFQSFVAVKKHRDCNWDVCWAIIPLQL